MFPNKYSESIRLLEGGIEPMFTLTFNGKPFDPDDFHDALVDAAVNKIKEHLHVTRLKKSD